MTSSVCAASIRTCCVAAALGMIEAASAPFDRRRAGRALTHCAIRDITSGSNTSMHVHRSHRPIYASYTLSRLCSSCSSPSPPPIMLAPDYAVVTIVILAVAVGLVTAAWFASRIALISIDDNGEGANARLINNEHKAQADDNATMSVPEIAKAISDGANAFLYAEYQVSANTARCARSRACPNVRAVTHTRGPLVPSVVDGCVHGRLRSDPPSHVGTHSQLAFGYLLDDRILLGCDHLSRMRLHRYVNHQIHV
jgi:hypothetical protein